MRTILVLALLGARVAGQNGQNGVWFIYPTEGHTYQHMDTVNVTYESPFPTPTLFGWCDGGKTNFYDQRAPGYNASVAVVLNFTSGTPCWFNLRPGRVAGFGANSPAFNLLGVERPSGGIVHGPDNSSPDPAPSPSLTVSSSSSITSTTAAPTGTETQDEGNVSSDTPAARPNSQGESDDKFRGNGGGLGGGQSAGIAIGAIVGALIIAAGFFFWLKKRTEKAGKKNQPAQREGNEYNHQCQYHNPHQHEGRADSSWGASPATYAQVYEHNTPCTCVCPAHGQAPIKMWPAEMNSTNSPSEISASNSAWAGRTKIELPA